MSIEKKLEQLGLQLPPAPPPGGVYRPILEYGSTLYVSGHGPVLEDGSLIVGRLGVDMTIEDGYAAARQVGLTMLSTLKAQLGDLNRIKRLVKTLGMVRCDPSFADHPKVINGFSELFRDLLGPELGVGVRSAVGMNALPGGIAVEIEAMFELHSE